MAKISKMDAHDLEMDPDDRISKSSGGHHPLRKTISIKLNKSSPKGSSQKKSVTKKKSTKKVHEEPMEQDDDPPDHDGDEDSSMPGSKVIAGSEPLHRKSRLRWDHKVNLIGEKLEDPLIHCCEKCSYPILIYGRMIPCKHVFCANCAKKYAAQSKCGRCQEDLLRVEQSGLGSVFVCTWGGPKHGASGCRRTYLSNRDLHAHVCYRHQKTELPAKQQVTAQAVAPVQLPDSTTGQPAVAPMAVQPIAAATAAPPGMMVAGQQMPRQAVQPLTGNVSGVLTSQVPMQTPRSVPMQGGMTGQGGVATGHTVMPTQGTVPAQGALPGQTVMTAQGVGPAQNMITGQGMTQNMMPAHGSVGNQAMMSGQNMVPMDTYYQQQAAMVPTQGHMQAGMPPVSQQMHMPAASQGMQLSQGMRMMQQPPPLSSQGMQQQQQQQQQQPHHQQQPQQLHQQQPHPTSVSHGQPGMASGPPMQMHQMQQARGPPGQGHPQGGHPPPQAHMQGGHPPPQGHPQGQLQGGHPPPQGHLQVGHPQSQGGHPPSQGGHPSQQGRLPQPQGNMQGMPPHNHPSMHGQHGGMQAGPPPNQSLPPHSQQSMHVPQKSQMNTNENYPSIPVITTARTANLISVPIQEENSFKPPSDYPQHQPPPGMYSQPHPGAGPQQPYAPVSHPPPHSSGATTMSYSNIPYHTSIPQHQPPHMNMARPNLSQPPPMNQPGPRGPPSMGGQSGPPPVHSGLPPQQGCYPPSPQSQQRYANSPQNQRYASPHYDENIPRTPPYNQGGGHSPRPQWGGQQRHGPPQRGPPPNNNIPPRGPPPASGGSNMRPGQHKYYN